MRGRRLQRGDLRRHTRAFEARRTQQAFCPDARTTRRLAPPLAFSQRARSRLSAPSLVCWEAGATVARDVRIADMNIDVPVVDDRRIEVVANGLPRWHGAQLVVDATLVSPVTCTGQPQTRADFSAVSLASDSKGRTPNVLCVCWSTCLRSMPRASSKHAPGRSWAQGCTECLPPP